MKLIFIDAENIGLKTLSEQDFSILDKVLVFSNDPEAKAIRKRIIKLIFALLPIYQEHYQTLLNSKEIKLLLFFILRIHL